MRPAGRVTMTAARPAHRHSGGASPVRRERRAPGQFHIELADGVERLAEPFPVGGHQSLWYLPASAEVACLAQLPVRAA